MNLDKPSRERERDDNGMAGVILWISGPPTNKASASPSIFQLYLPTKSI